MFIWKCIGKYFNGSDETYTSSTFINDSDDPLMILNGNADGAIIQDGDDYYFRTNSDTGVCELQYQLDSLKTFDTNLPTKFTFKARIYDIGNINGSIEFLRGVYIKFMLLNGIYTPCISKTQDIDGDYYPLSLNIVNGEWFDVELLWASNQTTVKINNNVALCVESENIISINQQRIVNCDVNAKICMDIKDLQFFQLIETSKQSSKVKIVEYNKDNKTKLGFLVHPEFSGDLVDDDSVFRIQFASIPAGTYIPISALTIEGCTFLRNETTSPYNECYKVYTDNATGNEIKAHVYFNPKVDHSTNVIYNVAYYSTNVSDNDVLNIDINVIQNGVSLCGRAVTWDTSKLTSSAYNSFMFKTFINTFITRDSFKALEGSYVYPDGFRVVITTLTNKGSGGILGGSFKNTTFKSIDSDNTALSQDVTFTYNDQDINATLTTNAKRADNDGSLYTPYRLFYQSNNVLNDIRCEVVSQDITSESTDLPLIYSMRFGENTPLGVVEGFNFYTGCIDSNCGNTDYLKVELIDNKDDSVVKCYEYNNLNSNRARYSFFNDLIYYNFKDVYYEDLSDACEIAPYKIVITSPSSGSYQDLVAFRFNNLAYVDCVTTWPSGTSYSSVTSEEVIFRGTYKNVTKEYHAIVAYENPSSRWYDNGVADWDPHRFVADEPLKRQRKLDNGTLFGSQANSGVCSSGSLSVSITFIDPVPYDLIRDFNYDTGGYNSYGVTHRVDIYSFYPNPICTLSLYAPSSHYTMVYSLPEIYYTIGIKIYRTSHQGYPMICGMKIDNFTYISGTYDTSAPYKKGTAAFESDDGLELNTNLDIEYCYNARRYPYVLFGDNEPSTSNPDPAYMFHGAMGESSSYDNIGMPYNITFLNKIISIPNYRIQLGCKADHSASRVDAFGTQLITRYNDTTSIAAECYYSNPTPTDDKMLYVDFTQNRISFPIPYYWKIVVGCTCDKTTIEMSDFKFDNLEYVSCTTVWPTNVSDSTVLKESVVFKDKDDNLYNCDVAYVGEYGRLAPTSGRRLADPHAFFVSDDEKVVRQYNNGTVLDVNTNARIVGVANDTATHIEISFKTLIPFDLIHKFTHKATCYVNSVSQHSAVLYMSSDMSNYTCTHTKTTSNDTNGNTYQHQIDYDF